MGEADTFDLHAWVRSLTDASCTLDPYERLVMLALARHADSCGRAWPGFTRLCAGSGVSRAKLVESLAELEARGLLVRHAQKRGQGLGSNTYKLPLEPGAGIAGEHRSARRTRPPRGLVRGADQGSPPGGLEVVRGADQGSPPRGPQLLRELPKETTQGTGEALAAPIATPVPLKLEVLKPPRRRSEQPRAARWRRIPDTWQPNAAHRELAAELGVNFDFQIAKLRDHEFDKPKSDPDAVCRNWLRNPLSLGGSRGSKPVVQRGSVPQAQPSSTDWFDGPPAEQGPPRGRPLAVVR